MQQLARVISFITNPIFILFPVPYLLVYRAGYGHLLAAKWTVFSLIFFFLSGIFVLYEVRMKVFSDMDVSRREQRPLLFGVLAAITAIYLFSLFILNAPTILFITVWGIMLGIVLTAFINMRVKASLHVGTITAVVLTLVYLYQLPYIFFILIPIVAWARITIKRHTQTEVLIGGLLGLILTFLMYSLLKYIYQFSI